MQRQVAPAADEAASFPVSIRVDAAKPSGALKPVWRFFGAHEPNYAYMKDGSKLLGELEGCFAAKFSNPPIQADCRSPTFRAVCARRLLSQIIIFGPIP